MWLAVLIVAACLINDVILSAAGLDNFIDPIISNPSMNQEMVAIDSGRDEYSKTLANRKDLLCVSFVKAKLQPVMVLHNNMMWMQGYCDWAVVVYDGDDSAITRLCGQAAINLKNTTVANPSQLVHCKRAPMTIDRPQITITVKNSTVRQSLSVPKSALYSEVLPYLSSYENVFLMDEDISLQGFDIVRFMRIWKCSFGTDHRPLIVQPLIVERTQYFPYVYAGSWAATKKKVFASGVGLVEQQVPFFDATFLQWFVKQVLSHTREAGLMQGVDQSLDRTWCRAADLYAQHLMHQNYTKRGDACAVIVGGANTTAVHHLNTRSLENKRANREVYRQKAQAVHERYKTLFPTWVQPEIRRSINPLDKKYGKRYRKYMTLGNRCVEQSEFHSDMRW